MYVKYFKTKDRKVKLFRDFAFLKLKQINLSSFSKID